MATAPQSDANQALIRSFLAELATTRAASPHTIKAYGGDVTALVAFLRQAGHSLQDANTTCLLAFLGHCRERGESARTRARRTAAIRRFFRFLTESGHLTRDPTTLLASPRTPDSLPKALTIEEMTHLLSAPPEPGRLWPRDRLILVTLYATGLRVSELAALDVADLDRPRRLIRVLGKGGKERRVPYYEGFEEPLETYLRGLRPELHRDLSETRLLLSTRGKPLSRQTLYHIVRDAGRRAGIARAVSPHTLRHSYATHLLHGGADLRVVQELLGHASIDTTQVYTRLDSPHLARTHRAHHPRA